MNINTSIQRNRTLENRGNEQRRTLEMNYKSIFDIPPEVYEEGMDYHWGRVVVNGELDDRYDKLLDDKWELVPRKKAIDSDPLNRNLNYKNCYHRKGHNLFKRPKEIGEERLRQENRMKNQRILGLESLRGEDISDLIG